MAQDWGAAQPIKDYAKGIYDKIESVVGDPSKPAGKQKPVDTSWHDEQVRKATESFKPEETKKLADRKPLGSAKTTKKKSGTKQTARKR